MKNYFNWEENPLPAQFSVGAVLFDKDSKEIYCHHFVEKSNRFYAAFGVSGELFILMRETPDSGESMEATLKRGLMEEFGAEGKIIGYLGSIKSEFEEEGKAIEKTTIYFLVEKTSFDSSKRDPNDEERDSEIEWHQIDFLVEKMKEQQKRLKRTDLDESSILEKAKDHLK